MAEPLRVLIIEDSPADLELLLLELRRGGFAVTHALAKTEQEVRRELKAAGWDLIISDYALPQLDGTRVLELYRESGLDIPFILMSGTVGEEIAVEAMRAGAHDYIMKDRIVRLVPAIQRELRDAATRREHREFIQHIEFIAYNDPVTRLPNQRRFLDEVQSAIGAHAAQQDVQLVVAVPEISRFKEIRTTLSQVDYDALIVEIGRRLRRHCPEALALARIDEYTFAALVLLQQGRSADDLATHLLHAFEEAYELDPVRLHLDANVGMAIHGLHGGSGSELLRNATVAAALAHEQRHPFALYSPGDDHASPDNLALLGQLREAIRSGQLLLHYQPIIDVRDDRVVSVEALVRWQHPQHGLLAPERFLALAESSNLIAPLTEWVIGAAFLQWRRWSDAGIHIDMSINLSVRDIQDPAFVSRIIARARELRVEPAHFVLEVTESGIMTDSLVAGDVLAQLHDAGFRIAIDDFGTGYSSLAYLQKLPVDSIKVDRNFVTGLNENPQDLAIVHAVLDFATGLGKDLVAEGVESAATLQTLRSMGCHFAQGYHIARPMAAEAAAHWLRSGSEQAWHA